MSSENPESLPPEEKATNPVAPIVAPVDPEPPRPHRITWVLATGGVVVSIISAVLSYLALVTNRESILASNRAYIVVTDAYSIDDFKLDTLGDLRIDLRNEGKTPAHSVLLTSNITVTDTELPDFNDLRSYKSDYESSLGPNGASSKPQTLEGLRKEMPDVISHKVRLFYIGLIEYEDVFHSGKHQTEWCFEYALDDDGKLSPTLCKKHNSMN